MASKLEQALNEERERLAKLDPSGRRLSRADLERLERAVQRELAGAVVPGAMGAREE